MGNTVDTLPVVSQTKSLVQVIGGDADGARRTQENFSRQCPVVSQTRSLVEVSMGDSDAALKTQQQFGQGMGDLADAVPGVGHIKGAIHYACGDTEGGDKAMMHATRGLALAVPGMAAYEFIRSTIPNEDGADTWCSYARINTRVSSDIGGVPLSEWIQALDDEMVVACYEVVKALNQRKDTYGVDHLTWDDVVNAFCSCHYIIQDTGNSKHIHDSLSWDETNLFKFDGSPDEVRKREIIVWLKSLMNSHGEQSTIDNASIFNDGTLNDLASIASQSGATVKDPTTLLGASEKQRKKVMEISVIRFPRKAGESKVKIYRIILFAWFQCTRVLFSQHDESGFEIDYDTFEFRPNTSAIDERQAARAKAKLSQQGMFDF